MRINEIITPEIEQKMLETAMYKCTSGPRFGRKVASIKQCDAPIDIAKRNQMKLTRAKTKVLQARRAKKTKKINPAAIIARRLNKFRKIK